LALGFIPLLKGDLSAAKEQYDLMVRAVTDVSHPANLTTREVDVIQHIALGMTDQEIADALYVSMKTVSNHVSNILRKTGTGNRTEAAAFAVRNKLSRI